MEIERIRSGIAPITEPVRLEADVRTSIATRVLIGLIALALITAPSIGFAGDKAAETGREGGLGAAAALTSLVYAPLKLVYAAGGLVVGSFAWAFTAGDTIVAEKVFTRSVRGTYVITPDHLTGEKELLFIGRDVEPSNRQGQAMASASEYSGGWVETPSTITSTVTSTTNDVYATPPQAGAYVTGVGGTTTDIYSQPGAYEAADTYDSGVRDVGSLPMATTYTVTETPAVSAPPPSHGSTYETQTYDAQGYDDLGW